MSVFTDKRADKSTEWMQIVEIYIAIFLTILILGDQKPTWGLLFDRVS